MRRRHWGHSHGLSNAQLGCSPECAQALEHQAPKSAFEGKPDEPPPKGADILSSLMKSQLAQKRKKIAFRDDTFAK